MNSNVEYLADGIVTLANSSANKFGLRSMYIDKLRGTLIPHYKYYFTLHNSHFTLLSRDLEMYYEDANKFDSIKSKEGYISSGNKYLDNILAGGFKKGSIILLELEPDTNRRFLALFLSSFVLNNIRSGGISFIISAADRPYTSTLKYIEPFCTKEDLKRLVFFAFEYTEEKGYMIKLLTNDIDKNNEIFIETYTNLSKYNKIAITYDLGWYEMRNENALNILRTRLANTTRSIKKNGDVEIIINRSNLKSMPFSEVISDLHLKLWEEEGVPLLSIKKPFKGIYELLEDKSKKYPAYLLIPIV